MDDLDLLLTNLRDEPLPEDSLARIAPRVHQTLRRRRITRYTLAAAALLAATIASLPTSQPDIPLPDPGKAIISVPDLFIPVPAQPTLSSRRAKPKATMLDEHTVQLASTDNNVIIYWSLE
jgi:hypothetical protein